MDNNNKGYSKYQWSKFNPDRSEQYVIRTDDKVEFDGLVSEYREKFTLHPTTNSQDFVKEVEADSVLEKTFCSAHNITMKPRSDRTGTKHWYDHRKKEVVDDVEVWYRCSGNGWRQA
jgi:hypothetical protein